MDNLLALEPELVSRLQARLAPVRPAVHVLTAAELADVTEEKQLTPAVHLVLQRQRVLEARPDGRALRLAQTWLAVVAVRNSRSTRSGTAPRQQAGVLGAQVLQALLGWQPDSATKPLKLVDGPAAAFTATNQYLPLAIEAELVFKVSNP